MILSSLLTLLNINLELFLLNNLSRPLKMKGLKYINVSFEFKHTEFFSSLGGYLLNTTL